MMITAGKDIGHLVKTIVCPVTSTWDVYSDVNLGLYHYHPKKVTDPLLFRNKIQLAQLCVTR